MNWGHNQNKENHFRGHRVSPSENAVRLAWPGEAAVEEDRKEPVQGVLWRYLDQLATSPLGVSCADAPGGLSYGLSHIASGPNDSKILPNLMILYRTTMTWLSLWVEICTV